MKTMANNYDSNGGVFMTILTVLLYFFTRFTVTEWAGIATILAALTTAVLNVYRFIQLKKRNKS